MPKSASASIEHGFEPAHVRDDVAQPVAPLGERHDRVADELAGAVVGDVAAAVGVHELGADRRRRHEHVRRVGARCRACRRAGARAAAGSRRRARSCSARCSAVGLAVRDAPEPAHPQRRERHASSASQSRVSSTVAHRVEERRRRTRRRTRGGPTRARACPTWWIAIASSPSGPSTTTGCFLIAVGGEDRDLRLVDDRQRHVACRTGPGS